MALHPQQWVTEAEEFIRQQLAISKKDGIVVAVSGGLDSSVVASLVVRAVGKEKVTALMLPERGGNPEANHFGKMIIRHLDIKSQTIYINPVLRSLNISSLLLTFLGGREIWRKRIEAIKKREGDEVHAGYIKMLRGEWTHSYKKYTAKINGRQRARLLYACNYADKNNLLLAGATHKTERSVGLFVKFGIDDCADIMPLKNMYRTQIVQIGEYLKVPDEILRRTPNPDMVPGVTDKYMSYLELPAHQVDLILLGLEREMSIAEIALQLHVSMEKVEEIQEIVRLTAGQRNPSLSPLINTSDE